MKNTKYHIVQSVLIEKNLDRDKIDTPNKYAWPPT
jgi:hypothetical protein